MKAGSHKLTTEGTERSSLISKTKNLDFSTLCAIVVKDVSIEALAKVSTREIATSLRSSQ